MDISKSQFEAVMGLAQKHNWLIRKSDALSTLLFDDCKSKEEQDLISELLNRFHYISQSELSSLISELALEIVTTPDISPENTIIAAMAADSSPDSSQYLVQILKVKLQELKWNGVEIVNTFGAAYKASKKTTFTRTNIVLIDEFVGSGQTVAGRCREINAQFSSTEQSIRIIVKVIFSSSVGINLLREKDINFTCLRELKRGISDFDTPEVQERKIKLMSNLESQLSPTIGSHALSNYSMGYGGTESLFGVEELNVPNSVFPIFWWPEYSNEKSRKTLLTRWLGD